MSEQLKGPGFHHIAIKSFDYDKTLEFYQNGLGMTRKYGWGEIGNRAAMLDIGNGDYIEVFEGRTSNLPKGEGGVLHYALRVASATDSYQRALDAGATSYMAPTTLHLAGDYPVTIHISFVYGLDGELIEFFENDAL